MLRNFVLLVSLAFFTQQYTSLLAAPSIEACPADSVQVEDSCKCNPEFCSKPPCLSELVLTANGTDTPGNCCPVYSCEGCANSTLLNGKCPCAPGSVLDSKNQCRCVDPYKTLVNNECVCDPDQCPLPKICESNFVEVRVQDGCCEQTHCAKCPSDSYSTNNSDDAVEDMCVCFPCKPKECGAEEAVSILQHGTNFPGKCCDIYDCVRSDEKNFCEISGVAYGHGDNWTTSSGELCYCQNGLSFCYGPKEQKGSSCILKNNVTYSHNESWLPDNCTNCTCYNGKPVCISHYCEINEVKISECQPLKCNKNCPEGLRLNKLGCPICKCNSPTHKYEDLLHKYNITKNELKTILEDYFSRSKNETKDETTESIFIVEKSTTITPIVSSNNNNQSTTTIIKNDEPYNWTMISLCIGIPTILALLVVFFALRCWCRGKKGSYDTNPASSPFIERVKTKKDTLLNNYIMK